MFFLLVKDIFQEDRKASISYWVSIYASLIVSCVCILYMHVLTITVFMNDNVYLRIIEYDIFNAKYRFWSIFIYKYSN